METVIFGQNYIDRIEVIWKLNEPPLRKYPGHRGFYTAFRMQYEKARKLSAENSLFTRAELVPLLQKETALTDEEESSVEAFCANLIALDEMEFRDLIMCLKLYEKLIWSERIQNKQGKIIQNTSHLIILLYHLCDVFRRGECEEATALQEKYKAMAIQHINEMRAFLAPEKFRELSLEEQEDLLRANRFESLFWYPQQGQIREILHKRLELSEKALELVMNPEFQALSPDFHWEQEVGSSLYYVTVCSSIIYIDDDIDEADMERVHQACLLQLERVKSGGETSTDLFEAEQMVSYMQYLKHEITPESYIQMISEDYLKRDKERYDLTGINENVYRPAQILEALVRHLDLPGNLEYMSRIYRDLVDYALKMPNNQYQEIFLVYMLIALQCFREVEGGTTFYELCCAILANCSPSVYVHSRMVAKLSAVIGEALAEHRPELFVGLCDCRTEEEVHRKKEEIGSLLYHCGMCHDIGKLPYLDVIGISYRQLFSEEFDIIKLHTEAGYHMLRNHASTKLYADVALGHQKWYNNKGGYPEAYQRDRVEYPILTDIIMVADCLDAATDIIFRSYNKGITLDDYIREVREDAGIRYSKDVSDALSYPGVYEKLQKILTEGREQVYFAAYKNLLE